MGTPSPAVDRKDVEPALERVLASQVFARAERSREFLRYLVEAALAQPPVAVKEYTIAADVFDRGADYNPAVDATVRVEASRLRARLREYYDEEGSRETLVIEVPKGGYAAVLRRRPVVQQALAIPAVLPVLEPTSPDALSETLPPLAKKRSPRRLLLALGMLLTGLLAAALLLLPARAPRAAAPAKAALPSLAVFPLANHTGDPHLDPICDGLTDELIRQLSQLPAVRVISRAAVQRSSAAQPDPLDAGRALGVAAVLTGQWRRTADHSSLLVELSGTQDGTVLLDREYAVDRDDLRFVQAELQRDVIRALHLEGVARDPGQKGEMVAADPQAYREFLEGESLARSGSPAGLHQALTHFERSVALDPRFDLAWSAMASDELLLGLYFEAPREHMPLARRFAQRALALNPTLGEAHGALGLVDLVYDWNPAAAAAETSTAGAEAAAISTLSCTAHLIESAGRPGQAEEMLYRMLTYDPDSPALTAELGCVNYYRGNYTAALLHYRRALAADPRSPVPYWGIAKSLSAEHHYEEAAALLGLFRQRNGFEPPLLTAETGYALGMAGRRQQALALARQLEAQGRRAYVDPYFLAVIYASLQDRDAAFAWLDKALQARSPFLIALASEPKWRPFHADPRFQALVRRIQAGGTA